jgi:hypothetical protein
VPLLDRSKITRLLVVVVEQATESLPFDQRANCSVIVGRLDHASKLRLAVSYIESRRHLPVIELRRAAQSVAFNDSVGCCVSTDAQLRSRLTLDIPDYEVDRLSFWTVR